MSIKLPKWIEKHAVYQSYIEGCGPSNLQSVLEIILNEQEQRLKEVISFRAISLYIDYLNNEREENREG